jgi:hypothetical protein
MSAAQRTQPDPIQRIFCRAPHIVLSTSHGSLQSGWSKPLTTRWAQFLGRRGVALESVVGQAADFLRPSSRQFCLRVRCSQQLVDLGFECVRLGFRGEAGNDSAISIDQELGEVPFDGLGAE